MAQIRNIIGALFVVTLILGAPLVLAGEIANKVSTTVAKVVVYTKIWEKSMGTHRLLELCQSRSR